VFISSTSYARLFLYESVLRFFSLIIFRLCDFLAKANGEKAACKMLMKLTTGNNLDIKEFLSKYMYRQPSLYVVFLSAILRICDPEMASFLEPIL